MKRLIFISMLAILPALVTACHTVEGAGHDITDVGRAGQSAIGGN